MNEESIRLGFLIRALELKLLELFSKGELFGTTHTCIGQELSAVALRTSLKEGDVVFSNHRCHGHYLACTDDVEGLVAEVMGRNTGTCGGIGGSQHLCRDRFFSNGIQGGGTALACGAALHLKRKDHEKVAWTCIGDGTLGEGILYESLNLASKWNLPVVFYLENNLYAQSTSQKETLAGSIPDRFKAFGIETFKGDTWNPLELMVEVKKASSAARKGRPVLIEVETYRLKAHSKGDDDRDIEEVRWYEEKDYLTQLMREGGKWSLLFEECCQRVEQAHRKASLDSFLKPSPGELLKKGALLKKFTYELRGNQRKALHDSFRIWLEEDEEVILLEEDIRAPYGGAFKVTGSLSEEFPDRVLNTPISEAAITGLANGLALLGSRPVLEIMFGDFSTLAMDQILNHAAKFTEMYQEQVDLPMLIRTPMGGGRGYGPTHSQCLEKHFAGIPGLDLILLHHRVDIPMLFTDIKTSKKPIFMIENKFLYSYDTDKKEIEGYEWLSTVGKFPTTVWRPQDKPDLTIVAFGRMGAIVEELVCRLHDEEELFAELILPLKVSPWDDEYVLDSVEKSRKLLVVEEGAQGFDLGSEVLAHISERWNLDQPWKAKRIGAKKRVIPSAGPLEKDTLPGVDDIFQACLFLYDE